MGASPTRRDAIRGQDWATRITPVLHIYGTCHKLRKSADFRGNPSRISMKVYAESHGFLWTSMRKVVDRLWWAHRIVFRDSRNRLSGSAESSFGRPQIHLVGVLQTIFGRPQVIKSAKSFLGVRKIVLWKLNFFRNPHRLYAQLAITEPSHSH